MGGDRKGEESHELPAQEMMAMGKRTEGLNHKKIESTQIN